MKKTILTLGLIAMSLVPALGQGRQSIKEFMAGYRKGTETVRGAFVGVTDSKRIEFGLEENGDTLRVELGGKIKDVNPAFYALDVRKGDTLTVSGVHEKGAKDKQKMVSATVLSIDYATNHDEQSAFPFSLDVQPSFQGSDKKAFSQWVTSHLVYPEKSRLAGSTGTTRLAFTIDTNGEMIDLEVLESSGDVLLDSEAFRVVKSAPAWAPGEIGGKAVRVRYSFPVIFALRSPRESSSWSMRR